METNELLNILNDKGIKDTLINISKARDSYENLQSELCYQLINSLKESELLKDSFFDMYDNNFGVGPYGDFGVELSSSGSYTKEVLNKILEIWNKATRCHWLNLQYSKDDGSYINSGAIVLDSCGKILCRKKEDAYNIAKLYQFKIKEDPDMYNK